MKRSIGSEDECDVFSESSKEACSSPSDTDNCQFLSRKKRRGLIEKRRRDRINTSLTELRRLVPAAFEKQGSAKLEKAEILQLTVDHLKMLHAKGLDALACDPHKFATNYHSLGFHECASEVARYLVTEEGLDIQHPLRLRLMSHLQCFAAQRELATKQATTATWGYPSSASTSSSQTFPPAPTAALLPPPPAPPHAPIPQQNPPILHHNPPVQLQNPPVSQHNQQPQQHDIRYDTNNDGQHSYLMNNNPYGVPTSQQSKPYRPWGAEVAY